MNKNQVKGSANEAEGKAKEVAGKLILGAASEVAGIGLLLFGKFAAYRDATM